VSEPITQVCMEQVVVPNLDAAYNLARHLTGNAHDAEDVVQESCLRAIRSFDGYRGGDSRSWLLTIVRNTTYTWLRKHRQHVLLSGTDEEIESVVADTPDPDQALVRSVDAERVHSALEHLPAEFKEVIVLRELEQMSYKEIADICQIPLGTVMSRLTRARRQLQQLLEEKV
jgi:RNA polymerase sigma-70 factor, ECF subfamily